MNRSRERPPGVWRIASGHADTTRAARQALEAGGNAADAAVAAAAAASISEPLLCSLGGGALAIVHQDGKPSLALDAFTQTPRRRRVDALDFYPIIGNFGTDVQEFHVGLASIATPGVVAGLTALHQRFGRLPLSEALLPAIDLAGRGTRLNAVQRYALCILEPIVRATPQSARLFGLTNQDAPIPPVGARIANHELGSFLDCLGREGPEAFYQGEPARRLAADSIAGGGHLSLADLAGYRARWRRPLRWRYRDALISSVPPPAFGGMMLSLALGHLATTRLADHEHLSPAYCRAMIAALVHSDELRLQLEAPDLLASEPALRGAFAGLGKSAAVSRRGTTHISIDDGQGLAVAMTLSNGEGSGYVLPGTGIVLNNMLGEEDINRAGFHRWPTNRRLASMMAPLTIRQKDDLFLLGSGGSNRIRSALTQVIARLVDYGMPLNEAIMAPRLHVESSRLSVEIPPDGWPADTIDWYLSHYPQARTWPERNLYFGGVHAVGPDMAAADSRRSGQAESAATPT